MAGEATHAYEETAPLNVTRLAGTKLTIMGAVGSGTDSDQQGVARGGSENWPRLGRQTIVETQVRDAHVRLALGETTIVGAVVMGDQALSFPLQEIIAARADVADIMAHLRAPSASFSEVIAEFWREERGRLG